MVNVSARSTLPPELDPRGPRLRARRRPPALRLVNVIAAVLSLLVLVASVGGYVVVKWFDGSIARIHLNLGQDRPADAPNGSQNWLLVGTDSRAGTNGQYGDVAGERSDTTILTHLDGNGTTTNVSFPRDTLVTIPSYTDSKGKFFPAHKDKFNAAIMDGGPSLLVRTIEGMTGIRIDHYVSVDLEGFKNISQAINGVQVCILHSDYKEIGPDGGTITNINDGYSDFHGHDGVQTVVGDQALAFVRQRHGLPDGDIDRIKRQQQFLGAVFRQATTSGVLLNPIRVTRLLSAVKDSLTLDQDTSLTDLEKLAIRLRSVGAQQVLFETIPQRGLRSTDTDLGHVFTDNQGLLELTPKGQNASVGNVQILDQTGFNTLIAKLKDENPPSAPAGASSAPATPKPISVTVPPSQVLVTVQNGVGRNGLASQVTTALGKEDFRTGAPGPAANLNYSQSEVHYAPGDEESAKTVAAAVPGSVLKEDSSVTTGVVLIVGANYSSVLPVNASGAAVPSQAPTPAPSASVSPLPPPVSAASAGNRCTY